MIGRRHPDDAQSFEEAWTTGKPADKHIADLVSFAEALCEAAVVEPSTQFLDSLRASLMAEAATVLKPMPRTVPTVRIVPTNARAARPTRHPARRRVAGVTAALVASVGVVGLISSSASAVPGEMLYPVKRSVESVELAFHRDDASRGVFQLEQASERLVEARQLSTAGSTESDDRIAGALYNFASQAESGSDSLFSDFTANGSEQSIREVNEFAASATADLSALSGQLPTTAAGAFDSAAKAINHLSSQATSLCSACASADVESLVSAVTGLARKSPVGRATKNVAKPTPAADSTRDAASRPTTAAPGTSLSPSLVPPLPTVPSVTTPPVAGGILDPVVGGLLGNNYQEGLIPGIPNGLGDTSR